MMTPRPYQEQAVNSLFKYMRTTSGNPVLDACVGSGKSLMIAEFVKKILNFDSNARVLMLTHVKELIEQNFEKLIAQVPFVDAGIYSASIGQKKANAQVVYAGIQSIYKKFNQIGKVNVIIIDEVHLLSPNAETMYRSFITAMQAINPKLRVVGFTGTPYRTKEGLITEGENALFDDVCHQVKMADLIKLGFLVPLVSKTSKLQADMKGASIRQGDYALKEMQERMERDNLTEKALDEVEYWASDRKCGLFFCSGVEHAEHVRDAIRARGYNSETISGKTPKAEREDILKRFKRGEIKYLTNDSVLTTGTDIPMLDLIVLLRKTKSAVLYTQMLGRGVRCFGKDAEESRRNGKENCLVLDFAGNIEEHGCVDKINFKPKREKGESGISITPVKTCQKCREPSPVYAKVCDWCNHPFPIKEREISHDTVAYAGAIMSDDIPIELKEVTRVAYTKHVKVGKPDSLKVTYFKGVRKVGTEWVCLEHEGFARRKAETWWRKMYDFEPPETVEQALKVKPYTPSGIWTRKNGKYEEIVSYRH